MMIGVVYDDDAAASLAAAAVAAAPLVDDGLYGPLVVDEVDPGIVEVPPGVPVEE